MASYSPGYCFGRGELDVFFEEHGQRVDPAEITFDLFYLRLGIDLDLVEESISPTNRIPANPAPGEYYAPLLVPTRAESGEYGIRWRWRAHEGGQEKTAVMRFHVD